MAEETDRSYALAHACLSSGVVSIRMGDFDGGIAVLERALNLCQRHEFPLVGAVNASGLGYAYALTGRLTEAVPLLEDAVARLSRSLHVGALPMVYLGESYLLAGRSADAIVIVNRALELAANGRSAATKPGRCGSEARLLRMQSRLTSTVPRPPTGMPPRWLPNSECPRCVPSAI